jgi:crotonobetainyl-CoA:carnitine CoA-transferase CaiB-like acyl-CoA transferase
LEVKSRGPLADTRIVECVAPGCPLAVRLALAFAGRVACDLGAQVTVVQNTPDPCSDGWVALVYLEADWPVLRDVIDDPRLREPRFSERAERRKNAGYINAIIEQAFTHLTRAQVRDLALEKRLPLGPVWSPAELASDPQNVAREFLRQVRAQSGETLLLPRLPLLWNGKAVGAA